MKILHVSTADNQGGSARSAYRIHTGLRQRGHTSRMLVKYKVTDDPDVRTAAGHPLVAFADRVAGKVGHWTGLQYLWYPSTSLLRRDDWLGSPDVIQLFNTHGNFFAHTALPWISARKPVVWRLSDMWPFTGHCAYSYDCDRWRTGCGSCPIVDEYPPLAFDSTALLWKVKKHVYQRSRLTLVAPSRWIARLVAESPLLGRFPLVHIPNGIDTVLFQPEDKVGARRRLGVPESDATILLHDPGVGGERKGRRVLLEVAERVKGARRSVLVFGRGASEWTRVPGVWPLGEIREIDRLRDVYSAADVFVFPALAENLPNVALESMACGTPLITYPVGGLLDIVLPDHSGVLVADQSGAALSAGVESCFEDREKLARLSRNARDLVVAQFGRDRELDELIDVYRSLGAP